MALSRKRLISDNEVEILTEAVATSLNENMCLYVWNVSRAVIEEVVPCQCYKNNTKLFLNNNCTAVDATEIPLYISASCHCCGT